MCIILLVRVWGLGGYLLGNSCPLGWPFVLFFVYLHFINFHFGFKSGDWFLIAPVHVHCFSITLTQENRGACNEIQQRRYDELSWKMCINSVWREKRRECQCGLFSLGECHHNARAL